MTVVRTVTGDMPADRFAAVMVHEHILFDIVPPGADGDRDAEVTLANRWQIDHRSNEAPANAHQRDRAIATVEVAAFIGDGGDLIVDQSVDGLARDPEGLLEVSRATGCAIVAAAGTYTAPFLSDTTKALSEDALEARFVEEVTVGLDGTAVRAGIIGEIGCSAPLEPIERRALKAAARAARRTGCGLSVHPGRDRRAPFEIVEIVAAEGADLSRTVICHMDRTFPDGEGPLALAQTGVCVEWDFFGIETSHYWMDPGVALPTDRDRLAIIAKLFDAGRGNQVLVSHDICTKTRMQRFGGHGYGHLLRNGRELMARLGFGADEIKTLLRDNPLRLLALPSTP
ncbi:MAG: aryldialkylphosphatase [Pseudomonadota bacterium]